MDREERGGKENGGGESGGRRRRGEGVLDLPLKFMVTL